MQVLLRDVLGQLPLSSIDVERSHANVQVDMNATKPVPKRPSNAQCDAYICAVALEHEYTKKQVELETLGANPNRVKKSMRARKIETGAPGNGICLGRLGFNADGTVKGRDGLLKGLLSVKAGGVRKTRPETRRVSGFNAFQKANKHLFKCSRLGSTENRQETRRVGELWRSLSADARERYEEQAREMQAARDDLKGKVLSSTSSSTAEAAESAILSQYPVKRLNNSRLDKTLGQVSGHPVWQAGLGLSDHVAALRAKLVMEVPDANAMRGVKRQYDEAFSYDSRVQPNPPLPKFIRPCCLLHGGTCQHDPHFDMMQCYLKQFHDNLIAERLGGSPTLVELKPDNDQTSTWLIVATVALRPQCHIVIHLHSEHGFLHLTMQNGSIALGTMHRVIRKLLVVASRGGTDPAEFCCTVRLYGVPEMDDSEEMQFLQPDEAEALSEHVLAVLAGKDRPGERRKPAAPVGGCRLPFGLSASRTTKARKPTSESKLGKGKDAAVEADEAAGETLPVRPLADKAEPEQIGLESSLAEGGCLLSPAAQAELDLAMQLQRHADQEHEDDAQPPRRSSGSGVPESDPTAAPRGSRDPLPRGGPKAESVAASSSGTVFHHRLGILSVGWVKRRHVVCYFCQSRISKGGLKFEYAHKLNKPARSIHAGCLAQVPDDVLPASIATLGGAISSRSLPRSDHEACQEAVQELRSRR